MTSDKYLLRKRLLSKTPPDDEIEKKILLKIYDLVVAYNPKILGIYIAQKNEFDISSLMLKFPKMRLAAPKILKDKIIFVGYNIDTILQKNEIFPNYYEPSSTHKVVPNIILVPGIAFDLEGYRLGRGRGDYDKYLLSHNVIKIGLCSSHNLIQRLPREEHDIKMDYIVTENTIIKF
ncbi:MAG: hypothetical protein RLZZ59_298 [Pseudomonadota bacterium]|jgi:5-formyltetrahydrofolate cyclo-ligase